MMIKPTTPKIYTPQDKSCVLNLDARDVRGSKIYDRSGKGNHGAITGAVLKPGNYGVPILKFDGVDDYVNCGNDPSLNILKAITVLAWIKPLVVDDNKIIVKKSGAYYFQLDSTKAFEVYIYNTSAPGYHKTTKLVPLNKWTFVAMAYKSGNLRMHLNNEIFEFATVGDISSNENNVSIGSSDIGSERQFNGSINNVSLYNRILSISEISQYFNHTKNIYGV